MVERPRKFEKRDMFENRGMMGDRTNIGQRGSEGSGIGRAGIGRSGIARWLAGAVVFGIVFMATWFPSDSVEVERGDALWLVPASLLALGTFFFTQYASGSKATLGSAQRLDRLDLVAILIVIWMGVAALAVRGVGDFRSAINEWWWWVAAALFWIASRRFGAIVAMRNRAIALVIGLTLAQATLAAHQVLFSLPADRARFLADPDRHLAAYGIVAPEGSAERELFVARLFEGGPTGSFALANSLAGFLVLGLILAAGVLWVRRRNPTSWLMGLAIGIVGIALWWTQSRSGMLAVGVGVCWSCLVPLVATRVPRRLLASLGIFALACALGLSLLLATFSSVWGQFPRSLAFRFQYWQSTIAISTQHPWVGIGPGNFQDTYPSYRLDEASEGIADPHNWFMETLAAGGWPAAILLLLLLALCIWRRSVTLSSKSTTPFRNDETVESNSIGDPLRWSGASACLVGTVMAVRHWIMIGAIPDPDGLFLGAVIGGVTGWGSWRLLGRTSRALVGGAGGGEESPATEKVDFFETSWPSGAVVAVLVHWMAAGGWTIPGNAIAWLLIGGLLVPSVIVPSGSGATSQGSAEAGGVKGRSMVASAVWSWGVLGWRLGGLVSLLTIAILWFVTAESKVSEARRLQASAILMLERGQLIEATEALASASRVDPWDPKLALREAEAWHWRLLRSGDTQAVRAGWRGAIEEAARRNPRAYQVQEVSGGQAMVAYQCYGKPDDLQLAEEAYRRVIELAPGEIRSVAQLVVLAMARGEGARATELRARLDYLSGAGGHSVRELSKVMVWAVDVLGDLAARSGGVKRSVEAEMVRLGARD